MRGAPSIGGSAQAVSNANAAQDTASLTNSASQARAVRLNEKKLQAEINLLNSQSSNQRSQARSTANLANISQNIGNLSTGLHGLTEGAAKGVDKAIKKSYDALSSPNSPGGWLARKWNKFKRKK